MPDPIVARVDGALRIFLDDRADVFAGIGPDFGPVLTAARSLVLDGGKRLRPLFAYWAWRATRPESDDDAALVTMAAAIELLHGCALVHDDVIDDSATRRGKPAAHAFFADLHRSSGWTGSARDFGTAGAILLGDLLLSWSDALFVSAGVPAAQPVYDAMREQVMAGQYLDVLEQARGAFRAEAALRVIEYKTTKYTVQDPLRLGAVTAGAGPAVLEALDAYGGALGEAFQLRDDVLGVFGEPSRTGKPSGDDLREGKRTLLVALAMAAASPAQAGMLRAGLGDRALSDGGVAELRDVIVSTGALDAVEKRIASRADEARAALAEPALRPDARAALDRLVSAATDRAS